MKGILYKELISYKKESAVMVLVWLVFMVVILFAGQNGLAPLMGGVVGLCSMSPGLSLQIDRINGWNRFICASPIPRSKVMLAKYISVLLTDGFLFGLLVAAWACGGREIPAWAFLVVLALVIVCQSITTPVALRFGQNMVVAAFFGIFLIGVGIMFLLDRLGLVTDAMIDQAAQGFLAAPWPWALAALGAALAACALSWLVSSKIFKKMEL